VIPTEPARVRLAVLSVVVFSLFAAMFARLWYLQVLDSRSFVEAAKANQVRFVYEEPPRGRILDRQGRVIVDNRRSQAITVDKAKLKDHPEVVGRLAALLAISTEELQRRIADPRFSPYKPVPVAHDITEEVAVYLEEHNADFPGIEVALLAQRTYPHGITAAHILGYVGEINDVELEARRSEGYRLGDAIGKSGVELGSERDLRGQPGIVKLEVDSRGKVLRTLDRRDPVQGSDVQLTIDLDVQQLAEESLAQGLGVARGSYDRQDRKFFRSPAGAVVVLDPRDGSVLAMASEPTYDPSAFVNGIKPDTFAALQDPANHFPLTNRAIQGQYAPGSTFKLVTAIAALQWGVISANTTVDDPGFYTVPRCRGEKCVFRNAGSRAYGRVDLPRSLTVSSDVYYYTLGARFWLERGRYGNAIQETARELGLGERTGIPLPTEKPGRIPDPESRKKLHEHNPRAFPEGRWFTGDSINLSIGQGEVVVTPLQLANLYATFANGGTLFEPRVVARVVDHGGQQVRDDQAKPVREVNLTPAMREPLLQGLWGAVAREEGTAFAAFAGFPPTFPVAGKTGTAEVHGKQDTAVFAAFAPAYAPQYAVAVVMEEAGFGGSAAAPVARRILEGIAGHPPGPVRLAGGVD
jgi:penicillin-binding protein 2